MQSTTLGTRHISWTDNSFIVLPPKRRDTHVPGFHSCWRHFLPDLIFIKSPDHITKHLPRLK